MSLVPPTLWDRIFDAGIDAQLHLPGKRDMLLSGINPGARGLIPSGIREPTLQFSADLDWLNTNTHLADGSVPLVLWLEKAVRLTRPTAHGAAFRAFLDEVNGIATGQPTVNLPEPTETTFETPEAVLFESTIIPYAFLETGHTAGRSVARVSVPRIVDGQQCSTPSGNAVLFHGSGWLIAPDLIITNQHVVNARPYPSPAASHADFLKQAAAATIQFDYDDTASTGEVFHSIGVEAWSADLDYAILRIEPSRRSPLQLSPNALQPRLSDEKIPVNIIHHPDGGPKMISCRNNLVTAFTEKDVCYLTDTKFGSSGSPVCTDSWTVVALHRGSRAAEGVKYMGRSTAYINVGTHIAAILADLKKNWKDLGL